MLKILKFVKLTFIPFYIIMNTLYRNRKNVWGEDVILNIGCGQNYIDGMVNIDIDRTKKLDLCINYLFIKNHFKPESVREIIMFHSISYLNLWQALMFFEDCYNLLKKDGKLILEFPDIFKCSEIITKSTNTGELIEGIRGIFAFDLDQINHKQVFMPYSFGWCGWHIKQELLKLGFTSVEVLDPLTHDKRKYRDTRIVAIK